MHKSLIANSALKVIYLCGPRREGAIIGAVNDLSQYTLGIRGHRYPFYPEGPLVWQTLSALRAFMASPSAQLYCENKGSEQINYIELLSNLKSQYTD